MTVIIVHARTTSHRTILRKGVAAAEAHHCILVLRTFWQVREILTDRHESIATIEVVAVNHSERFLNHILTHQHSMVGAPRLHTSFWTLKALWKAIDALETQFAGDNALIL